MHHHVLPIEVVQATAGVVRGSGDAYAHAVGLGADAQSPELNTLLAKKVLIDLDPRAQLLELA